MRRAFTLTELLVTIALIALLLALVLVSFRAVRGQAGLAATGSDLRQIGTGYASYSSEFNGAILPGYVSPTRVQELGLTATTPSGQTLFDEDVSSYVWRLAPYVEGWESLMTGYRDEGVVAIMSAELENDVYGEASISGPEDLGIARTPSYGLNARFLGGDDFHGPAAAAADNPWDDPFDTTAARSVADVGNAARMIVMAPTQRWDADVWPPGQATVAMQSAVVGAATLRPPYVVANGGGWSDQQWTTADDLATTGGLGTWSADGSAGIPVARDGGSQVPTLRFDLSTQSVTATEMLVDMRLWIPKSGTTRPAVSP